MWAEKTGKTEAFSGNDSTRLGDVLEPFVADLFARRNEVQVEDWNELIVHPDEPRFFATPDFKILSNSNPRALETKAGSHWQISKWKDEPPLKFQAQLQWQLACAKLEAGHIASLLGADTNDGYSDFEYEYDKSIFEQCAEIALNFLEKHVKPDIPPVASADDKSVLDELRKGVTPKDSIPDLTEELLPLFIRRDEISTYLSSVNEKLKVPNKDKKEVENQIKQVLLQHETTKAYCGGKVIDFREVPRKAQPATKYTRLYFIKRKD